MSKHTFTAHLFPILVAVLLSGAANSSQPLTRISNGSSTVQEKRDVSGFTPGGRRGLHGMIVFGARASGYFFSHIPMFHAPHDVQVVFPTELEAAPSNLADGLYTFKPDDARLSLDDVVLGTRLKIVGMLFRGNFEQNGKPIGKVTARVHSPLKPLTQALGTSGSGEVTYVAFGKLDATYLIHRLSRAPDFDQVIRCDFTHSGITAEMLRDGVMLMFPDKTHPVEERLRAGKHQATMRDGTKVFFTVETVFSTLVGPDFTQSLDP